MNVSLADGDRGMSRDLLDRKRVCSRFSQSGKKGVTQVVQPKSLDGQDVRSELEPMGLRFQRSIEFLPWQHILIFSKS